ncbi:MAG: hypothetical protein M3N52_08810, partial [Actinomycetota bacterium]|nr:hypothetical protein [Actinomycetota bacterium]
MPSVVGKDDVLSNRVRMALLTAALAALTVATVLAAARVGMQGLAGPGTRGPEMTVEDSLPVGGVRLPPQATPPQ